MFIARLKFRRIEFYASKIFKCYSTCSEAPIVQTQNELSNGASKNNSLQDVRPTFCPLIATHLYLCMGVVT